MTNQTQIINTCQTKQRIRGNAMIDRPFVRKSETTKEIQELLEIDIPHWASVTKSKNKETFTYRVSMWTLKQYKTKHICTVKDVYGVASYKDKITSILEEVGKERKRNADDILSEKTRYSAIVVKSQDHVRVKDKINNCILKSFRMFGDEKQAMSCALKYIDKVNKESQTA